MDGQQGLEAALAEAVEEGRKQRSGKKAKPKPSKMRGRTLDAAAAAKMAADLESYDSQIVGGRIRT